MFEKTVNVLTFNAESTILIDWMPKQTVNSGTVSTFTTHDMGTGVSILTTFVGTILTKFTLFQRLLDHLTWWLQSSQRFDTLDLGQRAVCFVTRRVLAIQVLWTPDKGENLCIFIGRCWMTEWTLWIRTQ